MSLETWAWEPTLDWSSPAGRLLERLAEALEGSLEEVTVFGSSPLQIGIDPTFVSGDVDVFACPELLAAIEKARLGKGMADPYIEAVEPHVFRVGVNWRQRACVASQWGVGWVLPHPVDILVGKIRRLADKDLRAFLLVQAKLGRPTESDLIEALGAAVDIYRPAFDEENPGGDPIANTRVVWKEIFGRDIDVREEIIRPALAARQAAYGLDVPDYKARLRERAGNG